jgi:hypothetical protein
MIQVLNDVPCRSWNKSKLIGQCPPLRLKEIQGIRVRLQLTGKSRDLAIDRRRSVSVPESGPPRRSPLDPPVRSPAERMGGQHRPGPAGLGHAFAAPHKTDADLSADQEPLRRAVTARSHQTGEHRSLPRHLGRGCPGDRGKHGRLRAAQPGAAVRSGHLPAAERPQAVPSRPVI